MVHLLATGLFGRHIGGRAEHDAGLRQLLLFGGGASQAKIKQLDAAGLRFQPNIGRLDIAMNQPVFVRLRQARGNLASDAQDFAERQREGVCLNRRRRIAASRPQAVVERLTAQQRHGDKRNASVVAHLVDGDNVFMLGRSGGLRFADKPLARLHTRRQAGLHCLQRHAAVQKRIFRLKHHAHAALAEHPQHAIAAQPAQFVNRFGRGKKIVGVGLELAGGERRRDGGLQLRVARASGFRDDRQKLGRFAARRGWFASSRLRAIPIGRLGVAFVCHSPHPPRLAKTASFAAIDACWLAKLLGAL